eukprot:Hpha_TRINITY_DN23329_c0_g1::TRINITY_DN23329_c0_g1_i1::g.96887::m.96887
MPDIETRSSHTPSPSHTPNYTGLTPGAHAPQTPPARGGRRPSASLTPTPQCLTPCMLPSLSPSCLTPDMPQFRLTLEDCFIGHRELRHDPRQSGSREAYDGHPPPVGGAVCVWTERGLLVFGGRVSSDVAASNLHLFEPHSWVPRALQPPRPWPVCRSVCAHSFHRGNLIIYGGIDAEGRCCYDDVWAFDTSGGRWTCFREPSTDPTFQRYAMACASDDDSLYCFGGCQVLEDQTEYSNKLIILSLRDHSLTIAHTTGRSPPGRGSAAAGMFQGKLYVIGGADKHVIYGDLWMLDVDFYRTQEEAMWREIHVDTRTRPPPRVYGSAVVQEGHQLFVFGGERPPRRERKLLRRERQWIDDESADAWALNMAEETWMKVYLGTAWDRAYMGVTVRSPTQVVFFGGRRTRAGEETHPADDSRYGDCWEVFLPALSTRRVVVLWLWVSANTSCPVRSLPEAVRLHLIWFLTPAWF